MPQNLSTHTHMHKHTRTHLPDELEVLDGQLCAGEEANNVLDTLDIWRLMEVVAQKELQQLLLSHPLGELLGRERSGVRTSTTAAWGRGAVTQWRWKQTER